MILPDVQKEKKTETVSAKISKGDKDFIKENNINLSILISKCLEEFKDGRRKN